MQRVASTTISFLFVMISSAAAAASSKDQYHLFNPTPRDQMRELSTDRPDQTESPYTVDAGHYQIESDIVKYSYDRYRANGENTRSKAWNVAPSNLKAGLTNNTDLQIIVDNYVNQTDSDKTAGTSDLTEGVWRRDNSGQT